MIDSLMEFFFKEGVIKLPREIYVLPCRWASWEEWVDSIVDSKDWMEAIFSI
jgi:hypothetical protein